MKFDFIHCMQKPIDPPQKPSEQLEFFEIPSPCINVCESNDAGYCKGCYRNRDERFFWQKLSNGQKRDVLRACRIRRVRAINRKNQEHAIESIVHENLDLF